MNWILCNVTPFLLYPGERLIVGEPFAVAQVSLHLAASSDLRASVLDSGKARQLRVCSDRRPAVNNEGEGWRVSMFAMFLKVFSMILRH